MEDRIKKYLAAIGRRGGLTSRRRLDSGTARDMVKVREARRAFREFHASCFWSFDPTYKPTLNDVEWIGEQLMRHGGRRGWEIGARLCR